MDGKNLNIDSRNQTGDKGVDVVLNNKSKAQERREENKRKKKKDNIGKASFQSSQPMI